MIPDEPYTRLRPITLSAPNFQTFTPHHSNGLNKPRSSNPTLFFQHNSRIAIALAPCALFLLDLGSIPVLATLTLGLMISYILDSLHFKSTSFFSLWLTLIISQTVFIFSSSLSSIFPSWPLFLLSLSLCFYTTLLISVWASLQFKFIQIENRLIVIIFERLLFSTTPVIASAIWTWASVSAMGMSNSAYYLMAFLCLFYWIFSIPRVSSFKSNHRDNGNASNYGGHVSDDSLILGELESCVHTLTLLFLPVVFHLGSHYSTLFKSLNSVCDIVLLFFVPFLFQLYAAKNGALWWVTKNWENVRQIQIANGAVALVVVTICLEIRVIFYTFGRYLHVPPPLNYLLVTIVMLGGASGCGAYALGMVGDMFSTTLFTILFVLVSTAGAIVIGFPLMFLPVPILSGYYLARFFTKKSLPSYFAFVMLSSLMVTWFVIHNYWNLNIWLAGMALKSFCKLVVASVILAMAVPGLAFLPLKFHFVTEIGLISHALLICYIEDRFYNYSGIYYFGLEEDVMYPSYMVVVTTFLGLASVRRLFLDHRIGSKAVWILTCLYSSKLVILFITSKSVLWVSAILLLAISPPLLLYKDKSKTTSRMKPWQGLVHAGVVALSAWFCRETIFDALQWWNGRPPSDGLLLGFYILLTGLACIPIIALHFHHVQSAKRFLVLVVALGLLFILMQPPIPLSLAFRSELIRAAHQSADDISIYGFVSSKPSWPSWLLIATIILTLAAVTSIIPIKYIVELRAFYAVGVGATFGIYICAEYFLQATIIHPLIVTTIICGSVFIVFTHFPSASSTRLLPWVFALLAALFPVTYLLEGQLRVKNLEGQEGDRLTILLAVEGARISLLGLYAALFMLIALEIKFELASLLREKSAERGVLQNREGRGAGFGPKMRLMQQRRASAGPTFSVKKLVAEGSWMPVVGNVSTGLCFIICLILNIHLTGGSNRAIFILAPILLLLNQDSDFVAGFGDRQRYFPVTAMISSYLLLTALYRIWEEVWNGDAGWGMEIGGPGWFFAVKNAALLILTLPNHILFNRFMWDQAKQTDAVLLLTMPLNLPSIIISDLTTVKILGLLGVIYSLSQYLISRQIRIAGMKYI